MGTDIFYDTGVTKRRVKTIIILAPRRPSGNRRRTNAKNDRPPPHDSTVADRPGALRRTDVDDDVGPRSRGKSKKGAGGVVDVTLLSVSLNEIQRKLSKADPGKNGKPSSPEFISGPGTSS